MSYPLIEEKYKALEEWYDTTLGKTLSASIRESLSGAYELHGHIALVLGLPTARFWLDPSHFAKIYEIPWPSVSSTATHTDVKKTSGNLLTQWSHFPFPNHSIDLILMPHILGLGVEMNEIMPAIDYILRPQGSVILIEKSWFGLWQLRPMPAKVVLPFRFRNFLKAHDYSSYKISRCFLKPGMRPFWSLPASLYIGCAQKCVSTLTLQEARGSWRQYFGRKGLSAPSYFER